MTYKESIYALLKKHTQQCVNSGSRGVTASEIANELNIRRNVVSHYLNELCAENKAIKSNTRPVYFVDNEVQYTGEKIGEKRGGNSNNRKYRDPFSKLIGYDGSLKDKVEQCKAAASYPNNGLPVLLTGDSGVGKSFIAQLIYEYAMENGYINNNAPFIIFNCAEYADNPELLSANLFGYQRGAFTGADNDKPGLIEMANGGYLFLDEIHRFSPEGQEKLFLFLDKGLYRRLGETEKWRSASIRFIFATTEDPEKNLLKTFLRRIPLIVNIPSLSKRPLNERINMVYKFYREEAKKIEKDIYISKQVLSILVGIKTSGNIGRLINVIKISCAHAYNRDTEKEHKNIHIDLLDLPRDILTETDDISRTCNFSTMIVYQDKENSKINEVGKIKANNKINEAIMEFTKQLEDYKTKKINFDKLKNLSNLTINKISDELLFNKNTHNNDSISYNIVMKLLDSVLKIMENRYGIRYYGNSVNVLAYCLNYFWQDIYEISKEEEKKLEKAGKDIKQIIPKCYLIAKEILSIIEAKIDYKFDERAIIYLSFYILSVSNINTSRINAIIVAHGYSTASSIASVVNKLLGEFIFEAFDMPIEVSNIEIAESIKDYFKTVDTSIGNLILVDMGSLKEIYKPIINIVNGDIAIVNNITTELVLDIGNRIMLGQYIKQIVEESIEGKKIEYKYIKCTKVKRNAVITTCISGTGTAIKIKNLLEQCIGGNEIKIIAYDYNRIKNNGLDDPVFSEYNVRLVISTSNLNIKGVQCLYLEDLIEGNGYDVFKNALEDVIKDKTFEQVNQQLIKLFSIQNVLDQLTILNPNKIMNYVGEIVSKLEIGLETKFKNDLKVSLYIHLSVLIERLIMKEGILSYNDSDEFSKCHKTFIALVQKTFSVILNRYKVELPIGEIQMIYYIIESKIGTLKI